MLRLKGSLNWTPFYTSKTNIMVISENSLYGLIFGPMVAKGKGIPLKVCFLPGLVGKEDKQIVQHAGIQQGHETLPSNMVDSNVVIINEIVLSGLILSSKWATALGYPIDSMNFVRPCG